ncbi:hypothetical protein ACP3XF_38175, partial [Escherichia coli]
LVDSGRGSGGRRALVAETAREEKAGSSGVKQLPQISIHATSGTGCSMPDATLACLIWPNPLK